MGASLYLEVTPLIKVNANQRMTHVEIVCAYSSFFHTLFIYLFILMKGGMDIAVLRDLLSLKKNYPDRVHLILGNRDINKIRFLHELTCLNLEDHPGVYWAKTTPSSFISKARPLHDNLGSSNDTDDKYSTSESDQVKILRWMLEHTMGCPDTFNLRKQELQMERARSSSTGAGGGGVTGVCSDSSGDGSVVVTDDEVVEDFIRRVLPRGELTQYLKEAELAVVIGDLLFLHGGVSELNFGMYPHKIEKPSEASSLSREEKENHLHLTYDWAKIDMEKENNNSNTRAVETWVAKLKQFKEDQINDFLVAGEWAEKFLTDERCHLLLFVIYCLWCYTVDNIFLF
jgi:hypothetical protein